MNKTYKEYFAKNIDKTAELKVRADGILELIYLRINYSEEENIKEANWVREQFEKILQDYPDLDIFLLADFSNISDAEMVPDESMKVYKEMLKHDRIKKVATFGQTKWFAMLLDIIIKLSKTYNKLRFFYTREDALKWIQDEKNK